MKRMLVFGLGLLLLAAAGCAAGNERFAAEPAGFWAGLWHGLICVITFVVSLFNDQVRVYEIHNSGHLYDLGFVLGAMIAFGGSCGSGCAWRPKSFREKEWELIGVRIEEKVRKAFREGVAESDKKDAEWEEVGRKVEEKIKRELRNWAAK